MKENEFIVQEEHWQNVYQEKQPNQVSWFQKNATESLQLIEQTNIFLDDAIIDVGGGSSVLVDQLYAKGFKNLSVLDLAKQSLQQSQLRLGRSAAGINWINGNILVHKLPQTYQLWHDRAVLHFLTSEDKQQLYLNQLRLNLNSLGWFALSTFSKDGAKKCSGLTIKPYDTQEVIKLFGQFFSLENSFKSIHVTPWGSEQPFSHFLLRKKS